MAAFARRFAGLAVLTLAVVVALPSPSADARLREYWIGAVPKLWNVVPTQRDPIMGTTYDPSETVFRTVTYQRFTPHFADRRPNAPDAVSGGDAIPGPLIRARVGDRVLVHFRNLDTERDDPHSIHVHGFRYRASSDGAFIPGGFSGPGAVVEPGEDFTYRFRAVRSSRGVWPYHDHSMAMHESIAGGMYGAISIIGRNAHWPDREFVVFFEQTNGFHTINGRAFLGNTPIYRARVGERVQWDVLALGDEFHTFHVHGHRWLTAEGPRDVQTVGPAESFRIRWREDAPGTWYYHCHVEAHMEDGMISTYRVRR